MEKGFVPHFFDTADHQRYMGPIPAKDYYDPNGMIKGKREEFLAWHDVLVAENYEFNFQEKLQADCKSDVRLLKEWCRRFQ